MPEYLTRPPKNPVNGAEIEILSGAGTKEFDIAKAKTLWKLDQIEESWKEDRVVHYSSKLSPRTKQKNEEANQMMDELEHLYNSTLVELYSLRQEFELVSQDRAMLLERCTLYQYRESVWLNALGNANIPVPPHTRPEMTVTEASTQTEVVEESKPMVERKRGGRKWRN